MVFQVLGDVAVFCGRGSPTLPDFCREDSNVCVQYICPQGMVYDPTSNDKECVQGNGDEDDWILDALNKTKEEDKIKVLYGIELGCPHQTLTFYSNNSTLSILDNGNLLWREYYCL